MKMKIVFFLIAWLLILTSYGQDYSVKGKIMDRDTQEPLPFAIVSFNNSQASVVSDIDGNFSIHSGLPLTNVSFHYSGYTADDLDLLSNADTALLVQMKRIESVPAAVIPNKENPADRIMSRAAASMDRNNPEKITSFSYTSYNKIHFDLQNDTSLKKNKPVIPVEKLLKDSANNLSSLIKNHFFLMEFVTRRYFKPPAGNQEKIISSKASGMIDPTFVFLGTQLQSFGFYENSVTLTDRKYLNPVSRKNHRKYIFNLDGIYLIPTEDSIFVISFKPRSAGINLLKGQLYINSNGSAVQNVIAEPAYGSDKFSIRIYQSYTLAGGKQWFPDQLKVDLLFRSIQIHSSYGNLYPVGIGKTYIRNINLHPDFSGVEFNEVEVQNPSKASHQQDSLLYSYRPAPLAGIDSSTYRLIDSIGKAEEMESKLKKIDALVYGYVPVGIFNVDYRKYISYNRFEGFRLGAGLMTNEKVGSFFSLGGYFAYGTHDKKWKYSPVVQLFPGWESDTRLSFRYTHDVSESGQYSFIEERIMNSSEWMRNFWINQMDMTDLKEISAGFRTLKYLKIQVSLGQSQKHTENYSFLNGNQENPGLTNDFRFTEAGLSLKFAFREKFVLTPSKRKISLGTSFPMVWINFVKGIKLLDGQFAYTKSEIKLTDSFLSGKSKITLVTGKVWGNIPATNLYYGRASFQPFSIEAENSFGTMRFNEFLSSEFISLFLKQQIGLFNSMYFHPEMELVTNIGYGRLRNSEFHFLPEIKTLNTGYYESGVLINKILNSPFLSLGTGILYRYGKNSFRKISDNLAYKITIGINL